MIGIKGFSFHFPEQQKEITSLSEYADLSEQSSRFFNDCGIEKITLDDSISALSLATAASKKLLTELSLGSEAIDVIIMLKSNQPEYIMSSEVTCLQEEIGAPKALCFTLAGLGCVTICSAILFAKSFLENSSQVKNVLITYGSKPFCSKRFRYPVTITGDAGMGLILSNDDCPYSILDCDLESNGKYWDLFKVDYKNLPFKDWRVECKKMESYSFELAMESKDRLTRINEKIYSRNNCKSEDVKHYIMQNISLGAYHFYKEALGVEFLSVCGENLKQYGHLGSMDIMLNLKSAIDSGEIKQGEKVMIFNSSPVAAWSSLLLQV